MSYWPVNILKAKKRRRESIDRLTDNAVADPARHDNNEDNDNDDNNDNNDDNDDNDNDDDDDHFIQQHRTQGNKGPAYAHRLVVVLVLEARGLGQADEDLAELLGDLELDRLVLAVRVPDRQQVVGLADGDHHPDHRRLLKHLPDRRKGQLLP